MPEPGWLGPLVRIATVWRSGGKSVTQLFSEADPDLQDPEFVALVLGALQESPEIVDAWQTYSEDKRGSPSPYLSGTEVGFYDGGRKDVQVYEDRVCACAHFIRREAGWVLLRQRLT